MSKEKYITASIVVYKEHPAELQKIIDTFLEYPFSIKISAIPFPIPLLPPVIIATFFSSNFIFII